MFRRLLCAFALLSTLGLAGCRHRARRAPAPAAAAPRGPVAGLYWARLGEQPEGVRMQLWLASDGQHWRGAYRSLPWEGEFTGRLTQQGALVLQVHELSAVRALAPHERQVRLLPRPDGRWTGIDDEGHPAELVLARFPSPALRPGLWLSHWTGLPPGLAVETHLSRDSDGAWRASYQYQGTGGMRDGSFEGRVEGDGTLALRWTELAPEGAVSRGHGRLRPSPLGLRGTFGLDPVAEAPAQAAPNEGEWTLEPLEP